MPRKSHVQEAMAFDACPTCQADRGDPCRVPSGAARKVHATRKRYDDRHVDRPQELLSDDEIDHWQQIDDSQGLVESLFALQATTRHALTTFRGAPWGLPNPLRMLLANAEKAVVELDQGVSSARKKEMKRLTALMTKKPS